MGLWCNSLALRWKPLTIITKSSILDVAAILEYHSHKNTIVIRTEESLSVLMTMIIHYKELVVAQQQKLFDPVLAVEEKACNHPSFSSQ